MTRGGAGLRYWGVALPDGWTVGQIKNVAAVTLGKMLQVSDSGGDVEALYLRAASVQPDGVLRMLDGKKMWFAPREVAALDLRAGDVVVVEGGVGGYGRAAYVASDFDGWGFQNSINRLRPYRAEGRFLAYFLIAARQRGYVEAICNIVSMPHFTAEKLAAMRLPLPPVDEQRVIADYLDRETAQIDALIGKQERLIETLRERRAAVVEKAVSRGLEGAPTKPSGLTWTESVPEHWIVANIRRFAQMKTGHTPSRTNLGYWTDCAIPWVTLADVWQLRDGKVTWLASETNNKISELGLANSAAELLPAGTVVLSRTASVGFTGIMPMPMATSQDYWNWVCGPNLLPSFLVWSFRAMRKDILGLMIGSTHKTIYQPIAAAIGIAVPPLDEQRRIAAYLDEQTAKIDALIAKAERFIKVSKERRSALITAAVTGQIDVREHVGSAQAQSRATSPTEQEAQCP